MKIMPMSRLSLAAAAMVLAASPALADVKAGVDAWSRGDYARAVGEWKVPAERGDADAQFNLGQAYKLGRGVKADLARAEELFGRAAEQGHLQASDNYGLLLFQRGEHAKAMPYIKTAADRGDPRAQYLLGIAHFNGDTVLKDWVRAYALVSLAQQEGLPQAGPALAQMDKYIPLEQRQQSATLASSMADAAQTTRERQLTAVDLGASVPSEHSAPVAAPSPRPTPPPVVAARAPARTAAAASAENAVAAARAAGAESPRTAGADFTRPRAPAVAAMRPAPPRPNAPARSILPRQAAAPHLAPPPPASGPPARMPPPARPAAQPGPSASGGWRVQLGAFGVPANAEAMWNRVRGRPELSGRGKLLVPAGRVAKLQAGGFSSQGEAQTACARLTAAGFACLAVRN